MSSAQIREPASFGKRHEPHTVIVSRNGKTRQFTIRPVYFSVAVCSAIMLMVGYFSATAYLVFRDDLISASFANQARIKHEYEDRIAALRTKLDRVTSRQLLDQQAIESRVHELMARQENIGKRSGRMTNLLEKAKSHGLNATSGSGAIPVPTVNPVKTNTDSITTGSIDTSKAGISIASNFQLRGNSETPVETVMALLSRPGRNGGYGKVVEIRHKDGMISRYAHLSRITVKNGQRVSVGKVIGKVGSTGRSTGPHLHYEVRQGKTARNPSKYMQVGFKLRGLL
ncbi:Murein DD-endopeptidase MepM [Nymphon striatum]|nr:Murein DD-endopeptidase MepM [Nymphon striatum]